jgi:hypothetical protein
MRGVVPVAAASKKALAEHLLLFDPTVMEAIAPASASHGTTPAPASGRRAHAAAAHPPLDQLGADGRSWLELHGDPWNGVDCPVCGRSHRFKDCPLRGQLSGPLPRLVIGLTFAQSRAAAVAYAPPTYGGGGGGSGGRRSGDTPPYPRGGGRGGRRGSGRRGGVEAGGDGVPTSPYPRPAPGGGGAPRLEGGGKRSE